MSRYDRRSTRKQLDVHCTPEAVERFKAALRHRKENEMPAMTWPRRLKPFQPIRLEKEAPKPICLMTPAQVKARLQAGEDPLLLSLEHWVQNAAWIKEHGSLPPESMKDDTCALCSVYRVKSCRECPLGISQGGSCDGSGDTAWRRVWRHCNYENTINMVAVLASLKPPEPKVPQFYIDGEGEGKVALRLAQRPDGRIVLEALTVSRTGRNHWWCLLDIDQGGSVRQPVHISPNTGLDLDDAGRLRLQRET